VIEGGRRDVLFHKLLLRSVEADAQTLAAFRAHAVGASAGAVSDGATAELIQEGFLIPAGAPDPAEARRTAHRPRADAHIASYRIVLTEGCNLACKYCFEASIPDKRAMKEDVLVAAIDRIAERHPGEDIALHWFGGEPLSRFKTMEAGLRRLEEHRSRDPRLTPHHSVTTHGGLVTPERAAILAGHEFEAYVSIDGKREVNDINRLTRQGASTYDAAIRGYMTLAGAGVDTGFLLTPHETTLLYLAQSVRFLVDELGCRKIGINTPQPTSRGWQIDGAELARQMLEVNALCAEHGVALTALSQRIVRGVVSETPQLHDCCGPDGGMALTIAPDGHVGFCIVSWNDPHHSSEHDDAGEQAALKWKTRAHVTDTCRSCVAEMVCGGPCALEAQLHGLDPSGRCAFYRTYLTGTLGG
jgi:uncharacterized protein